MKLFNCFLLTALIFSSPLCAMKRSFDDMNQGNPGSAEQSAAKKQKLSKIVTISLSDDNNQTIKLELELAGHSKTIQNIIDDLGDDAFNVPIPLSHISKSTFLNVIKTLDVINDPEKLQNFFHQLNNNQLADLINAANYLDIPQLLTTCITEWNNRYFNEKLPAGQLKTIAKSIYRFLATYYNPVGNLIGLNLPSYTDQLIDSIPNDILRLCAQAMNHSEKDELFNKYILSTLITLHYQSPALSVCFSPDSKTLASSQCAIYTAILWDINAYQCTHTLQGHTGWINSVCFSSDGNTIASASNDNTIKIWNPNNAQCTHTLQGHTDVVNSVCFSPDGKNIASASNDNTIKIWNPNNAQCTHTLQGHTGWVRSVCFSPDGNTIASASHDNTIKIWSPNTGQCTHTLQGHTSSVLSVYFSPDGNTIASASSDKTIKIWSPNTGQCTHTLQGHTSSVLSVCFSPDGKNIASASPDKTIKLWDVNTHQCIHTLQGHTGVVTSVCFSPDGKNIASASGDKTIKLLNLNKLYTFKNALDFLTIQQLELVVQITTSMQNDIKFDLTNNQNNVDLYQTLPEIIKDFLKQFVVLPN